jgi:uncharacterized protein involved in exopolysaccharide biosynthesis
MAKDSSQPQIEDADGQSFDAFELLLPLARRWRSLLTLPLAVGALAYGLTFIVPPTFTSRTLFLPPQQQQSAAAAAIAQLGALSGLAGTAGSLRSPADQYVALLQSTSVIDRLIDEFKLMTVYEKEYRADARRELAENVRVSLGRRDGLIAVEVDDHDPQRAADIANGHVDELRRLTSQLALTEAQQRRAFFEAQLSQTRDRLAKAQEALQTSGFSLSALRADARASAEGYARLRAEAMSAEVRLQMLRRSLADDAPEVQQALSTLGALRNQLSKLEAASSEAAAAGPDYVSRFREFKYQETLFDLFARQYELARVDESREGALIQVVDVAQKAEKRSRPKRRFVVLSAVAGSFALMVIWLVATHALRRAAADPERAESVARLRAAFARR